MDTVLILGRPSTRGRGGAKRLQVYRTPIPVEELVLEDLDGCGNSNGGSSASSCSVSAVAGNSNGGNNKSGSFKSAFSGSSNSGGKRYTLDN